MPEVQAVDVAPRPTGAAKDVQDAAGCLPQGRPKNDVLAASVNENGCFESDRVIKCGYVERRTQKTRKWKTVYIVLRSNTLSVYKNEKETKLRHQVYLSDLTAVAFLKDPKHKRQNVFGLFSPSRNFHFQAPTAKDGQEWVDLIRKDAGVDDDDDEVILASPMARSVSANELATDRARLPGHECSGGDGDLTMLSSSPEPNGPPGLFFAAAGRRESFNNVDWSGNELPSHSDLSDNEGPRPLGASLESLTIPPQAETGSLPRGGVVASRPPVNRSLSQASILNDRSKSNKNGNADADLDRVIWHGWLWMLRSKGGVRQWKNMWAVLRPRNLILYKDESEYTAQWLVQLSAVVNVVDIDPLSKSKQNCLQIITEEKSYRFCAREEESLVQFIGAFKSLLARRRGLDGRGPPLPRAAASRLDEPARGHARTE